MLPSCRYEYPRPDKSFLYHIRHSPSGYIDPHRHIFLEFMLATQGEGVQRINGAEYRLREGTATLLLPYQYHEIFPQSGKEIKMYICNFEIALFYNPNEEDWGLQSLLFEDSGLAPCIDLERGAYDELSGFFTAMLEEYQYHRIWRKIRLKSLLSEALIAFDRIRRENEPIPLSKSVASGKNIWEVVLYLHNHYNSEITLRELSERFHYNMSHLSEQFKHQLGIGFTDFLHELRIMHACNLLVSTNTLITQIALEVGFGSFQSFSRVFHSITGVTPTQYRIRRNRELAT